MVAAAAQAEIVVLRALRPQSMVPAFARDDLRGVLPDPSDDHVLISAVEGGADAIVTANLRDFPTRVLGRFDVVRRDPDGFLLDFATADKQSLRDAVEEVFHTAQTMEQKPQSAHSMLRKARLPRMAKWARDQASG